MKMQEVIGKLRELAPVVATNTKSALDDFAQLHTMLSDALRANSIESVRTLVKACFDKADAVRLGLQWAKDSAEQLQNTNEAYREKLGPRGPKKIKDAPGQQILPGLEDEGRTTQEVRQ